MDGAAAAAIKPRWDGERLELWFGGRLAKKFRRPAPVQERLLTEFEEAGWPARIDDPLPYLPPRLAKRRIHNAINALNRHLLYLRFHGDGHGEGISWEVCG